MADAVDDLYALPPGEFTGARDALAKELREAGERDAAAAVKALRKPSVAAWALNRAARERRDELEELLGAGETLRRAHERLLSGKGDRAVLREATEHERAAVGQFARAVAEVAEEAGAPLSDPVMTRVRETLHAAALDESAREQLEAGRLERETEAAGIEGMLATAVSPQAPRRAAGAKQKSGGGGGSSAAERRAAREAHEAAVKELRAADRAAGRAEREAETARKRTERAAAAVEAARERLQAAEEDLAQAQEAEDSARTACRSAKEALAAAQAAADEAQRAAEG